MAIEITMPKLSDTMTEGTLIAWRKGPGERVERGDVIAEVETDKATMELEAFGSGILLETRVSAGEVVPVGTVIGLIGEPEEAAAAPPPVKKEAFEEPKEPETTGETVPETVEAARPDIPAPPAPDKGTGEKASPLVRRLAREKGIDLGQVRGSGPEGRITKEDLESHLSSGKKGAREPEAGPGEFRPGEGELEHPVQPALQAGFEPLTPMRQAIARTVTESWRTIPHFSVSADVDMAAAESLHHGLTEAGHGVSLTDVIIKAAAATLAEFPLLNASFGDDRIILHGSIDIGVAVDVDNGLLVPVVRNCEVLSLREIGIRTRDLIGRARSGKIRANELTGGTFTISNMGMLGIGAFTAVVLPPQAAILAVGTVSDRAVVRKGAVQAGRVMTMTMSADHRVVDGAYAARFLRRLAQTLENPVRLLV